LTRPTPRSIATNVRSRRVVGFTRNANVGHERHPAERDASTAIGASRAPLQRASRQRSHIAPRHIPSFRLTRARNAAQEHRVSIPRPGESRSRPSACGTGRPSSAP
jgi:hypothetical protein